MFQYSLCSFCIIYIISLIGITLSQVQIPAIACPNYFQYLTTGTSYIGKITIPIVSTGATRLDVQLSQRYPVQSNYYGTLSLFDDQDTTISKLQRGQPISYRIDFPLTNVVPKLTQIAVNGRVICSTNGFPAPSTSLELQHTLRPTGIVNINPAVTSFATATRTPPPVIYRQQAQPPPRQQAQPPPRQQTQLPPRQQPQPQVIRQQPQPPPRQQPQPQPQPTFDTRPQSNDQSIDQRIDNQNIGSVCGQEGAEGTHFEAFIVGGRHLKRGEYPWLTAIYRKQTTTVTFICGGSLVSSIFVLSAAHCFETPRPDYYSVTLGRYDLGNSMEDVESRDIQELLIHPEYRHGSDNFPDADIALIRMYAAVSFTNLISPICLWTGSSDESSIVGQSAMVAGWGTDENNMISAVPKKVQTEVVSDSQCLNSSPTFQRITTERTLCAGKRDGTGPCIGDSGGSLMVLRNNRWYLRGIVSAGQTEQLKCNLREYVVFCDVAKHLSWVRRYV